MRLRCSMALLACFVATSCTDGATAPSDGVWRYDRVSNGVRYAGALSLRGGAGVHRVSYLLGGTPAQWEFDIATRSSEAGVVFLPTSLSRAIVQGNSTSYSPDTFNCRWASGGSLSCVSVDFNGRGSAVPFLVTR